MAKYSTGGGNSPKSDSCQLCGETEKPLRTATIEGTTITVCKDCEPDKSHRDDKKKTATKRDKDSHERQVGNTPGYTISSTDSGWAENTSYGNTKTPYMKNNYPELFTEALEEKNMTEKELSEKHGFPLQSLKAIKQGNVVSEGIGRELIEDVESALDIELVDDI